MIKASQFNTFFIYESVNVGYNSYSNEFFIADPMLLELYSSALKGNGFDELSKIHPDFYNYLYKYNFIIDSDIDEFEMVKTDSIKIDNDDSEFHLIVNPTMNCNFKCWYCYETHIKDSKMDQQTIIAIKKLAINIIQNQKGLKQFTLSFFGGEPLLYFDKVIKPMLIDIYSLCEENNVHFFSYMTTNGLLINQNMLDVCSKYGLRSFQITLDGNREQHNKVRYISENRGSYDEIVNNIILIAKNKIHTVVRINCSAETMVNVDDILLEFASLSEDEKKYINFDFQKVWQEEERIENTMTDSRFLFRENGYNVGGYSFGSVLNSCYADKRYQATVNYDGEVFKCTARDFTKNTGEGVLTDDGTIVWNEKYEKRLNSKFNNAPCKECRILPICGGGCTQQALEANGRDYCVLGFNEDTKKQVVIDKFKELLLVQ